MKIYTRKGDDGSTSLPGGRRVPKTHLRVEAYGTVDELIAWTGLLMDFPENMKRAGVLRYIQDQLMRCAATLASEEAKTGWLPEPGCIEFLEKEIDTMDDKLKPLSNFILPGGNIIISYCHITRCVCRRAERRVVRLSETAEVSDVVIRFLNRLSDYYFVLSRSLCLELDIEEHKWLV